MDHRLRPLAYDLSLEGITQLAGAWCHRQISGLADCDDAGNILRAAAATAFLAAADEQRLKAHPLAHEQSSDALRRMKFVPAEAQKIDFRIERCLADHLHGIRVHESAVFMGYRRDFAHGLNDAGLVIGPQNGDESRGRALQGLAKLREVDETILIHAEQADLAAALLPSLGAFEPGGMLGLRSDQKPLFRPQMPHGGMHGIDRLRRSAGENDLACLHADQGGHTLACGFDGFASFPPRGMAGGGIGPVLAQKRQHRLQHRWIDGCRGIGVEVDHEPAAWPKSADLQSSTTPASLRAPMLDIRLLRDNPDSVKQRLANRGGDHASLVDQVLELDTQRRSAETERQKLQGDRNRISKEIGMAKKNGQDTSAIEAEVRKINERIDQIGRDADESDVKQRDLLLSIPNLPHEACPVGHSAEENPEVRRWGTKPEFSFEPKDHTAVAGALGMIDFEAGVKITGSAFVVYKGAGARLERALINFLLDLHTTQHGYQEVSPPLLVKPECLVGTGQLPKFGDQVYHSPEDDLYLIPTAEVPVTNLHREEIVPQDKLPINYAAYTPCFRREAGSAGLGTRGLIRMHQFDKVELVKITTPETSMAELETLTGHAEKVLQLLGLHYRVIELCTGDIGFGSAKTYDIEVWAPGQGTYLEVSSCSNFGDYQARRMNLRFKDETGKNRVPHTLNGSGTALARLFVALVETYQQADGTILIPEALRGHFGAEKIG